MVKKVILDHLERNFNYWKLTGYESKENKERLLAVIGICLETKYNYKKVINKNLLETENLLEKWVDICDYVNMKDTLICNVDNILYIKDELSLYCENENQYDARMRSIWQFIDKISDRNINYDFKI